MKRRKTWREGHSEKLKSGKKSYYVYTHLSIRSFCLLLIYDVAGENRPTGAYFIIEFDLTKVVIGIFGRKFSYDILLLYRSSTIH